MRRTSIHASVSGRRFHQRRRLIVLTTLLASILVGGVPADAQGPRTISGEPLPQVPGVADAADCWGSLQPVGQMLGGLSCASASCHGRSEERPGPGLRRQEYVRWLEHDPHAKAASTLESPLFHDILKKVSRRADGSADETVYSKCAACHDPQGLAEQRARGDKSPLQAGHFLSRGIGCESCHGPADGWIALHYQRGVSDAALYAAGMMNTDNLLTRSRACVGCHVGDDTHDMNHDMIAAGHPPLRFEVSAYHDLITRKHWTDNERIATPDFKARLWVAGQLAMADATLGLLESRARRASEEDADGLPLAPWPEFAEYDCFACHQRLRAQPPLAKPSGVATRGLRPGVPAWQPWNASAADRLLTTTQAVAADELARPAFFVDLNRQMEKSFRGDPLSAAKRARELRIELRERHPLALAFCEPNQAAGQFSAENLLALIGNRQNATAGGWAAAAQDLLALKAGYLALRDRETRLDPGRTFVSASVPRGAFWQDIERRLAEVEHSLRFGSTQFEWPAFDWAGLRPLSHTPKHDDLPSIRDAIDGIAQDLRTLSKQP